MKKTNLKMKTPITYYGGKQLMLKHILPLIPEHSIYSEAFFGGSAVYFAKEPAKTEFINDKNGEVINFYRILKTRRRKLIKLIEQTLHSEFQQKQAKAIYLSPSGHSDIRRAWALWVLSHQSFYAILDNTWKYSKSRNQATQLQSKKDEIMDIYTKRLERTSIFCREALDVIKKSDREDTFHYIDPPYYQADMGHYAGYTINDFEALLKLLQTLKGRFMLSSYPSEILTQYATESGWRMIELELPRSAGGGMKIEVLTINYTPPSVESMAV
jgi:DNA adenine methylase